MTFAVEENKYMHCSVEQCTQSNKSSSGYKRSRDESSTCTGGKQQKKLNEKILYMKRQIVCNGQSDVLGENPEVMLGTASGSLVQAAQVRTGKPCCTKSGSKRDLQDQCSKQANASFWVLKFHRKVTRGMYKEIYYLCIIV